MGSVGERQEALALAAQARNVAWAADGTPWQRVLRAISGGRWSQPPTGWTVIRLDTPWQDTPSLERSGWRERAANLADDVAFAVDCTVCADYRLGSVEQLCTMEKYQRCGLATAVRVLQADMCLTRYLNVADRSGRVARRAGVAVPRRRFSSGDARRRYVRDGWLWRAADPAKFQVPIGAALRHGDPVHAVQDKNMTATRAVRKGTGNRMRFRRMAATTMVLAVSAVAVMTTSASAQGTDTTVLTATSRGLKLTETQADRLKAAWQADASLTADEALAVLPPSTAKALSADSDWDEGSDSSVADCSEMTLWGDELGNYTFTNHFFSRSAGTPVEGLFTITTDGILPDHDNYDPVGVDQEYSGNLETGYFASRTEAYTFALTTNGWLCFGDLHAIWE
ncbi:hypothetical protein [Streptomyces sp. DSM 40750]|uniref:hypothetical protein n=1 Tax=Streptomyces sp. DSM 40750 TaxID=2801030 RepID=UPI00214B23A9|nr:hypothetical protein [Streptomyces sp. DSM 40750]UUU22270.1 hypothetical protein JIX55_19220 [Streptomyces sp. DSM 40750]